MDKIQKKHLVSAGLISLGVLGLGALLFYLRPKKGPKPPQVTEIEEKDAALVEMLNAASLTPRRASGPLSFEEFVALTKIKYTELTKRLLAPSKDWQEKRINLMKEKKQMSPEYAALVEEQLKFESKLQTDITKIIAAKMGLTLRDLTMAEFTHSANPEFHIKINSVFDVPESLTEQKMEKIAKQMDEDMKKQVSVVLMFLCQGDQQKLIENYSQSMVIETMVIDKKAMDLGIEPWGLFQAMQRYNYNLSYIFEQFMMV